METLKRHLQTRACDVYDLHEDKALAYCLVVMFHSNRRTRDKIMAGSLFLHNSQ